MFTLDYSLLNAQHYFERKNNVHTLILNVVVAKKY